MFARGLHRARQHAGLVRGLNATYPNATHANASVAPGVNNIDHDAPPCPSTNRHSPAHLARVRPACASTAVDDDLIVYVHHDATDHNPTGATVMETAMGTTKKAAKSTAAFGRRLAIAAWRLLRAAVIAAVALVGMPTVAITVAFGLLVLVLLPGAVPDPRPLPGVQPISVYAADGTLIAELRGFDLNLPFDFDDVSATAIDAVVAAEDQRFFDHDGVDLPGIVRAARANLDGDHQGGSTITQQLVKLRYLDDDPTLDRKLREAILAQQLEKRMSKNEILHEYLASAYFGSGATGLAAAADRYFRTDVSSLTISQAAMIAGMLPAPGERSPHVDLAAAENIRQVVINQMLATDKITDADATDELAKRLVLVNEWGQPAEGTEGPFTAVWPLPEANLGFFPKVAIQVQNYLATRFSPEVLASGLQVTTTLDLRLQKAAQDAVDAATARAEPTVAAAMTAVDPTTGHVLASADSVPWAESQVVFATGGDTGFQIGSTAKAFVLTAALEAGRTPSTTVNASASYTAPTGEVVRNFGGGVGGAMPLRTAVEQSWNVPFVRLAAELGPDVVASTAYRAGIRGWTADRNYGVSIALGAYETNTLDMATAFSTFGNGGVRYEPTLVLRVTDGAGNVLVDNAVPKSTQAIDPVIAANVTDVLRGVIARGTGTAARLPGRDIAAKTGTAEDFSAAWFVGYTPNLSAAVWLGHTDGVRNLGVVNGVSGVTGGSVPAAAWRQFATVAFETLPPVPFPAPPPLTLAGPPPQVAVDPNAPSPPPPPPPPPPVPVVTGLGSASTPIPTPPRD